MDELALAMRFVFAPFSNVLRAIRPGLLADAISEAALPLTNKDSAGLELVRRSVFSGSLGVVNPLA